MASTFSDTAKPASRRTGSQSSSRPRLVAFMEGVSLWLLVILFLALHSVYAEARQADTGYAETAGRLHFVSDSSDDAARPGNRETPANLLSTGYLVTVSGLIADTRLRQTFENTSQQWQEAIYVFPLPEKASVYGLKMIAGERVIEGEIRTRAQADREYKQAKTEGRQTAKVDQQRPNLFTTRLANIPPGEAVTVELRYQQAVDYQSGEFQLRLPTTLTPRYMPGRQLDTPTQWQGGWAAPTDQVPDADAISPFTVKPEGLADGSHQARVRLEINAGLPIASVISPSHTLQSTWNGDSVTVEPQAGAITMDRDLVIRWSPVLGQAPSAAVFHEQWQGEDYLFTLLVPGLDKAASHPRELIFVIDTSGSMAGASIRQAREALLRGLDTLGPDDRFNVIQFSHATHSLFEAPVFANSTNLGRARYHVRHLVAEGGTEMAPALDAALGNQPDDESGAGERVRQVVFITDGAVGNEAALFDSIRRQLGESRLFTVGIGSAPNMHFMREAARFGRGTHTAVRDLATLARPLEELFAKMQAPVLTALTADWSHQAGQPETFPERPGDLFMGEPLVQVSRGRPPVGEVTLAGRLPDGQPWQQTLALDKAAAGTGLHRHWASEKISSLMDQDLAGTPGEDVQKEVTALGLEHQLVTRYTSFVAVDTTPVRAGDETLESESTPSLLPDGSTPGMLRYPQTATPAPLFMVTGLMGFLVSLALLLRRRLAGSRITAGSKAQ
ncbi:marine proteobacterial sortase target protein [Marinobacter sp.]|uniref:marine proteobacterial sortase target protein n=1 Tax=Marinobacter sp. TaxID=50741 RepID=UPI003850B54F